MEPRKEQQSRFRIDKLEERIAPAHNTITVTAAAFDSPAVEKNIDNPHLIIAGVAERPGRVLMGDPPFGA